MTRAKNCRPWGRPSADGGPGSAHAARQPALIPANKATGAKTSAIDRKKIRARGDHREQKFGHATPSCVAPLTPTSPAFARRGRRIDTRWKRDQRRQPKALEASRQGYPKVARLIMSEKTGVRLGV